MPRYSKHATVFAALFVAAVSVVPSSQSAAAVRKCDPAVKGQILGNRVCAVKAGTYRWVNIFPENYKAACPKTWAERRLLEQQNTGPVSNDRKSLRTVL
jgi:hypothetical protein